VLLTLAGTFKRYQFATQQFMDKVTHGLLSPAEADTVKIFVGILPRPKDYKRLQELVEERGFPSVEEGGEELKLGPYEQFMLLLLRNPEVE